MSESHCDDCFGGSCCGCIYSFHTERKEEGCGTNCKEIPYMKKQVEELELEVQKLKEKWAAINS